MLTPEERDDVSASWRTCGGGPAMWRTGSVRSSRWSSCHLLKPRQVIIELVEVPDIELAHPRRRSRAHPPGDQGISRGPAHLST